jgi:hypothetical protein
MVSRFAEKIAESDSIGGFAELVEIRRGTAQVQAKYHWSIEEDLF